MFQIQRILIVSSIFALIQAQQNQQNNNNTKKLNVLILYESLCPDSMHFLSRQLDPNYDDLKDYIDIKFVPFGKSYSENNGNNFYCQHGPDECEGNRKQSCVLTQNNNQPSHVKFVVCAMTQPAAYFKSCAESAGLSGDIEHCVRTEHGALLQLQAEKITGQYNPSFVPTVIYNNVFDQELQDSSIRNFRGTVCRLLYREGILSNNTPKSPCA